jgi:hypothetical protein
MNLREIRDALTGITLLCNETHAELVNRPGPEWTAARVKLLALASHCISAGRLVEDLIDGPVPVLGSKDEESKGGTDNG